MSALVLSPEEIESVTQYSRPTMQLEELRRQGFYRARMGRHGVIVERSHYEAVTRGEAQNAGAKIKSINLGHLKAA